jgi:hypothetical protein
MKRTPIKVKTHANCRYLECGKEFKKFKSTDKYCSSSCEVLDKGFKEKKKPKPIPKISDKRKIDNLKYSALRIEFLGKKENKICPITKKPTTDIHHKKGRVGSLLLDTRFWIALSREGHKFVEENPIWAKENGYSLDRLSVQQHLACG